MSNYYAKYVFNELTLGDYWGIVDGEVESVNGHKPSSTEVFNDGVTFELIWQSPGPDGDEFGFEMVRARWDGKVKIDRDAVLVCDCATKKWVRIKFNKPAEIF
jgi:hypothetical protein